MLISDWSSDVCSSDLLRSIVEDVVAGRYSDVHLAAFLTATAALPFDEDEAYSLTKAIVDAGDRLRWPTEIVVRSEERRVGKEGVRQCRSQGSPYTETKKKTHTK